MTTAYAFILDGYTFPRSDVPARGPIVYHQPQNWGKQDIVGATTTGATVLTFLGLKSQEWTFVSRAATATKDKLLAVYNGRIPVLLKTPQDATGVNVVMTELAIQYSEPIEDGKFLCEFTLVRR
ncbi:MAG: hypothetical protein EHM35_01355 [Planctomycetaceae bacterium]|nr:MAG: hypothetical protein EHM35_01355 [Planctomycetaceae bacterium]